MSELQNLVAELTTWPTDAIERLIFESDNLTLPLLVRAAAMVLETRDDAIRRALA